MEQLVIVRINDKCGPLDRGDLYEDPLNEALENSGLGEVTGGGSQMDENFQIQYCELEVVVTGNLDLAKQLIRKAMNAAGAPKGSKIIIGDSEEECGINEQMAIYFDNVNLPQEVYDSHDINDVISEIEEALGDEGEMTSHGRNEACTIAYFTGPSFQKMNEQVSKLIAEHPLLQNATVEQSA